MTSRVHSQSPHRSFPTSSHPSPFLLTFFYSFPRHPLSLPCNLSHMVDTAGRQQEHKGIECKPVSFLRCSLALSSSPPSALLCQLSLLPLSPLKVDTQTPMLFEIGSHYVYSLSCPQTLSHMPESADKICSDLGSSTFWLCDLGQVI